MRRFAAGIVAALAMSAGLAFAARAQPPIVTAADFAVTELYTDLASHGRLLLGPYSRFGWHHPGPLYFYLQVPFYVASDRAGASLNAGAVAINVIAFALLLWTMIGEGRPILAAAVGLACLAFAMRLPRFLASPWTPHVTILPMLACLGLAAAVASGRTQRLAATAFIASFVAQTDLALGPPIAAVVALTLAALAWRARRGEAVPARDIALAVFVSVAAWSLPLVDAVRHHGGNLLALWQFLTQTGVPPHSGREALAAWSDSFAGMARGDLGLAWGERLHPSGAVWTIPGACLLLASLTIVTYVAGKGRRMFDAWFGTMTLAAAVVSLWSLTHVRDEFVDHEVFWLVALGALAAAIVVAAMADHVSLRAPALARLASRAPAILVAAALILAVLDFRNITEFERRWAGQRDVPPAVAAIEAFLDGEHSRAAMVDVDAAWAESVPIVLRLRQHHRRVAVSADSLFMFTDVFAPTGREDAWVRVQRGPGGAPDSRWQRVFDSYLGECVRALVRETRGGLGGDCGQRRPGDGGAPSTIVQCIHLLEEARGKGRVQFDQVSEGIGWFEQSGSETTVKDLLVH